MDTSSRDVRLPRTFSYDQTIHYTPAPDASKQHARYHSAQPHPNSIAGRQPSHRQPRARPTELLERQYAEPPAPLNPLQTRSSSKMSLFHLFSKPKVEKARGHSEPGQQGVRAPNLPRPIAPERQDPAALNKLDRVPSALPQQPTSNQRPDGSSIRQPALATNRKAVQWEAPPLFQAYPQAIKSGVLHIDAASAPQAKQSQDLASSPDLVSPEVAGLEDPAVAKFPKKIFMLVTSGYLLQYAETGPSDRRPEKVLQLRQNSAAFACDLVPGLRYVLQVSQRVDSQGAVVANSRSIFQKLGIRGATAKRETTRLLLIMSSAGEFEDWMSTIRSQIEVLNGKQARPDTVVARDAGPAMTDGQTGLTKVASQSHRYQIKRHPSKISVISPSISTVNSPESEVPPMPPQAEDDKIDTITIEDIEHELGVIEEASKSRANEDADTLSTTSSSTTRSVEPPQTDSLHNSQRISTTTTVATTVVNSPAISPTSSPTSDPMSTSHSEASYENIPAKSLGRNASSELPRQRNSVLPLMCEKSIPSSNPDVAQNGRAGLPDQGSPPMTASPYFPLIPPIRRMSVVSPALDPSASSEVRVKRESRLSPVLAQVEERPQSTLADLAPPSTWIPERVSGQRTSFILATSQQPNLRSSSYNAGSISAPYKGRRLSGQAFSLPLRVNPSSPISHVPGRQDVRTSRAMSNEHISSPVAAVHTLSAIVNPSNTVNIAPSAVPLRASSVATSRPNSHLTQNLHDAINHAPIQSPTLSLFPMPLPSTSPPTMSPTTVMRRSSSATSLFQQAATTQHSAQAQPLLRRPVSLQVRSDHAPFLRNIRNSTQGPSPSGLPAGLLTSRPVPIRNLKPSRASTLITTPSANAFAIDNFGPSLSSPMITPLSQPKLASPLEIAEESDVPSPLPSTGPRMPSFSQQQAPQHQLKSRSSLRASRRFIPHPSLPYLDFGVPVVGLGPPAPPPNVPLPSLPPPPPAAPHDGMSSLAGLGIST